MVRFRRRLTIAMMAALLVAGAALAYGQQIWGRAGAGTAVILLAGQPLLTSMAASSTAVASSPAGGASQARQRPEHRH